MCGFVGFLGGDVFGSQDGAMLVLSRMSTQIRTRGPDDAGHWSDPLHQIALGHRRLSIVDLSPAGHQPMPSASGRYVIAYNGEVYNHLDIRAELEAQGRAPTWRGHSDTETLVAAFDAWGVRSTVERAIGMFAFAVWDRDRHQLTLGRDRIGEKPLYYGWQGSGSRASFMFGSELKALRAHPAFAAAVDRGALALQMRHNYIPAPYSIYENVYKLSPGCLLSVSLEAREPAVEQYWSVVESARAGVGRCFDGNPEQAVEELETLLKDAVHKQMLADVPLGAFLSGGVDSSAVVALMQAQSSKPVRTFTIGFNEPGYNEAEHALAVARHLGTDHTELYITPDQAMAVIPDMPSLYDEPFSDSSQIPTFLVSRLARQHVTVALSGDGGDELFCGYSRYTMTSRMWGKLAPLPLVLRRAAAMGVRSVSPGAWNKLAAATGGVLPSSLRFKNFGDKLHKGAGVLSSRSCEELYLRLVSHWDDPSKFVIGATEPPTLLTANAPSLPGFSDVQRMMALDMLTYLPDDILVKVDRAAMGVSLETRVPFLDHRVVEFAWRLPHAMKLRDGQSKWALRQVLYRYVPKTLIERPKMGFGVPIGEWLRGPLRDWAEALLDESRLRSEGYLRADLVRTKWAEHLSGRRDWQYHLWDVLMFQAWLQNQCTTGAAQ